MGASTEAVLRTLTNPRASFPPARTTEPAPCPQLTLLQLITTVGEITDDDAEVVATVIHLLRSGQVRLCGNFRGEPLSRFRD